MTDNLPAPAQGPTGEVILYQSEDGSARIEVRLEGETVWLPQKAMADLFQTTVANISQHVKAIYDEGELSPQATIKRYLIVQTEGNRQVSRQVDHYNLDVIISVGYRVRSHRGTQFRTGQEPREAQGRDDGRLSDHGRSLHPGRSLPFQPQAVVPAQIVA
jgi:hypothetical protein